MMYYMTVPAIEYVIGLIMLRPHVEMWTPRFGSGGTVVLGNSYSTLYALERGDGSLCFQTHDANEIREIAEVLMQEYGVETWPI